MFTQQIFPWDISAQHWICASIVLQFWTWLPDTFVPVSEMQSDFFFYTMWISTLKKMHAVVYSANYDTFSYTYTY